MKILRTKVAVAAVICLLTALAAGMFGDRVSHASAQEAAVKMRPVQRIAADAPRFVAGEVLASFHRDLPEQAIEGLLKAAEARTLSVGRRTGYRRIAVPRGMPEEVFLKHLTSLPEVAAAQLNHIVYAAADGPGDPEYGLQWHFTAPEGGINMAPAWGAFTGPNQVSGYNGSGVTVAVIDTGLAYKAFPPVPQAPEWKDQAWKVALTSLPSGEYWDLVNSDSEPNDDNGHGTHVANTVSQNTNNGLLAAGAANGARIMPIKVLDASGSGSEFALAEAVRLAADHGAQVINMSLGFPTGTQASELQVLADAVSYAYHEKGVTIVAAAGNDGADSCSYPAAFGEVVCVGSTKYDGNLAWYSNHGADLEVVAPGGAYCAGANDFNCLVLGYPFYFNDQNGDGWPDGILQETFGANYTFDDWFYEGTSMASPHAAAVAALVIGKAKSLGLTLTPQEVREILAGSAGDKGTAGYDSTYGWGLVDASAALALVGGAGPSTPPSAPGGLTATAVSGSQINLSWTDHADNESGFKIERCQGSGCTNFSQIATVGANVASYSNTGLTAGTAYTYRVKAYNTAGDSSYSNTASAATPALPAAPANLAAKVLSSSQIKLTWTDKSTNEDGFQIERCMGQTCTSFALIGTVAKNTSTYTDSGLLRYTYYKYRVRAFNKDGNSNYTNTVTARTKR